VPFESFAIIPSDIPKGQLVPLCHSLDTASIVSTQDIKVGLHPPAITTDSFQFF
jgi:hypothetical protein